MISTRAGLPRISLPAVALVLVIGCSVGEPVLAQSSAIRGFPSEAVPEERKLETAAQAVPETANLRRDMDVLASEPHTAGSARSRTVAYYIANRLKEWGLTAQVERFEALLPYPTVRVVEIVGPKPYTAKLAEPAVPEDPTSADPHQMPSYNAYSATGDVTAEVVYANYGLPEDYEWLAKQGIRVKGKIVLTRYGRSWRGIKPKIAEEHGAVGCLIYSDPHEDGYFEGDAYPGGPMRPPDGVQRGSVMDMVVYPGDPLSPGWASERGSKRLALSEAKTLMKIPVLPISYADAQPILEQLKGPLVPRDWRGALPLTYHAGSGPVRVHIRADFDWTTKPLYDVVAQIPGTDAPDEWVIAGNHHDAWVNGADDPVSGTSALLETARTLSVLQKQGWKPKRTVYLTFWDGEEFGLVGSTEWVEKHQDELRKKAVVYINSDNTGKGWLNVGGSHTLEVFAGEVADSVPQPGTNVSTAEYFIHHPPVDMQDTPGTPPRNDTKFTIGALGAGSDYQGFLDYLGIASLNDGFAGQTKSGIYHSVYDSIYWYRHFSDGTYADGKALSQFTSTALLRLADAPILPFEFGHFAATVQTYTDEIAKEADTAGHKIDLAPVRKQLDALKEKAQNYDALLEAASLKHAPDTAKLARLNADLIRTERVLTRPDGLPNRPWYKHQIYAPGFYTGYSVKTLPGIREAVETKNWKLAQQQAAVVEQCLSDLNQVVSEAIEELAGL
jgi:N-acetylated-alpha-linked acidic dipeptidase